MTFTSKTLTVGTQFDFQGFTRTITKISSKTFESSVNNHPNWGITRNHISWLNQKIEVGEITLPEGPCN